MSSSLMPHGMTNPIKEDAELRQLLIDLHSIETKRDFARWKTSFCKRFNEFLTTEGSEAATASRNVYQQKLTQFVAVVQQLEQHLRNGDLVADVASSTVKARKCVAEFHKHLMIVVDETNALIPGTGEQARQLGYTKFHMGAVLIRDGFAEYDRLSLCADIMANLRDTTVLSTTADKQVTEEMENYVDKFGMFCDIMADLGLHGAMLRCHQLNALPDEPEEESKPKPEPQEQQQQEDNDASEHSMDSAMRKLTHDAEWSLKNDNDSKSRLEMQTQLNGSFGSTGGGSYGDTGEFHSKSYTLDFPGVKCPDGPFIKFMTPEEYQAKRLEREAAAKLKEETDKVAYQPVARINFGLGNHYHGGAATTSSNVRNSSITPDLAEKDYSSGTDSPSSSDSDDEKKKTKKKIKKKVLVKKVVKKKVLRKKSKEGGTTEQQQETEVPPVPVSPDKATTPKVNHLHEPKQITKATRETAPVLEINQNRVVMEVVRSKVPPSALHAGSASVSSESSSDDDDDGDIALNVDFDKMEGVKGVKKSNSA